MDSLMGFEWFGEEVCWMGRVCSQCPWILTVLNLIGNDTPMLYIEHSVVELNEAQE